MENLPLCFDVKAVLLHSWKPEQFAHILDDEGNGNAGTVVPSDKRAFEASKQHHDETVIAFERPTLTTHWVNRW